jgi:hypothetical protein
VAATSKIAFFGAVAGAVIATGCLAPKSGTADEDQGPQHVTGRIDAKYGKAVPIHNGRKCQHGSFTVTEDGTGQQLTLCARSDDHYDAAQPGDRYER